MSDLTSYIFQSPPDSFVYPPAPHPEQADATEEAAEEATEEAAEEEHVDAAEEEEHVDAAEEEEHVDAPEEHVDAPVGAAADPADEPVVVAAAQWDWRVDGQVRAPFPGGPRLDLDDIPSWFPAHITSHIWDGRKVIT